MARTKRNAARTPGEPSQVRKCAGIERRETKNVKHTRRGRILQRPRHLSLPEKKRKAFAPANFHLLNLTVGMKRRRRKKRSVP